MNTVRKQKDPEPPELERANVPSLKSVWKGWGLLIGVIFVIILALAIFYKLTYG